MFRFYETFELFNWKWLKWHNRDFRVIQELKERVLFESVVAEVHENDGDNISLILIDTSIEGRDININKVTVSWKTHLTLPNSENVETFPSYFHKWLSLSILLNTINGFNFRNCWKSPRQALTAIVRISAQTIRQSVRRILTTDLLLQSPQVNISYIFQVGCFAVHF